MTEPTSPPALLTRDQILALDDRTTEDVHVPEWRGSVRIRSLTGTERDAFEAASMSGRGKNRDVNLQNFRARLVALSAIDGEGNRLFAEADVKALGRKSAAALDRLYDVATKLSRIGEDDVEELTEAFDDAQSEASTSD